MSASTWSRPRTWGSAGDLLRPLPPPPAARAGVFRRKPLRPALRCCCGWREAPAREARGQTQRGRAADRALPGICASGVWGERVSRQCKCGGIIRQHELTRNRAAWTCGGCGRYEIMDRSESGAHGQLLDEKDCSPIQISPTMDESTCGDTETSAAPSCMRSPPFIGQGVAAPGAQS